MKALYRIVAAVTVLLTVPAFYFMKLCRIVVDLGFVDAYFDDAFSVEDIINLIQQHGIELNAETFTLSENLATVLTPMKAPAIATLVFLCLMVLMVLAVFICSAFTNAKKVNLVFSVLGAVSVIGAIASFNSLTNLVISGEVPLSTIINALLADSSSAIAGIAALLGAGSLVDFVGELIICQLGTAFNAALIIFIAIAVWTASFILISLGEPKMPKEKKSRKKKS